MARRTKRPQAEQEKTLQTLRKNCPKCGQRMWSDYSNYRTITGLQGSLRLVLKVRRCRNADCERFKQPYRPEAEGRYALPHHEFGLEVIALVGTLRYQQHRSVPAMHQELEQRGLKICTKTVNNLLDRYDELLAVCLSDDQRLRQVLREQGQVILAIDGLQPDVGHEVLWVVRDCLSGEVLLACSLLSSCQPELAELLTRVKRQVKVPITGVISDGQKSIRNAVAEVFPEVPHQLCQFHDLREAARPIYEADRHAKKELKKRVRKVRPIERKVEGKPDPQSVAVRDYCSAVRSALTDDGRPPLAASGLKLHERLTAISDSLQRVERRKKGGSVRNCRS